MNNLTEAERRALDIMQKENFRGISKDNVMQFMTILDKVDPEVAKQIIAQLPEVVRGVVEAEKIYAGLLAKGIESCNTTTASCFETEDLLIESLSKEIENEDTTFEQKQFYYQQMAEAARRKEEKDTEHRNTTLTYLRYGREVILFGLCLVAGILVGKANVNLPTKRMY